MYKIHWFIERTDGYGWLIRGPHRDLEEAKQYRDTAIKAGKRTGDVSLQTTIGKKIEDHVRAALKARAALNANVPDGL